MRSDEKANGLRLGQGPEDRIPGQSRRYRQNPGAQRNCRNLDDGRVRVIAEGDEDKLNWFEDAIDIKNTLIQVSSIEKEYSAARGEFIKFYKLVEPGETDSRLDTAADHLKDLVGAVNNMNNNLGGKMDVMIQKQDQMIDLQHDLIIEVRESRKDLNGYLDQRFEKLESEVTDMKTALKAKGII